MRNDRIVEPYRAHELVAAETARGYQGVVWKDGKKVHSCIGVSLENVLENLRQHVDASFNELAQQRTQPPSGEEYVEAFRKVLRNLSDRHCVMLKAHYHAPQQTITATQLAKAARYSSYSAANLQYGNVGKALYEELPIDLQKKADGTPIYTSALATARETAESEAHWTWQMRPEVAYAIEQLGLAA